MLEVLDSPDRQDAAPVVHRTRRNTGAEQEPLHRGHIGRAVASSQTYRPGEMLHARRSLFLPADITFAALRSRD